MKRIGLIAVGMFLTSLAIAQEVRPLNVSLRIGTFKPQGRAARAQSEGWVVGGVDFKIRDLKYTKDQGQYISISVDFAGSGDFMTIPATINYVTRKNEYYWFIGAGASMVNMPRPLGQITEIDESIELAYQLGFGYDFQRGKSPLFAEIKFMGNGDDRMNGFAIAIGLRL